MGSILWKIINAFLAVLIFGLSLKTYTALEDFVLWASLLIVMLLVINFTALQGNISTRRDYQLLILPVLFLCALFGTVGAISPLGIKIFLTILGTLLFYIYQLYFPHRPPSFLEEVFAIGTGFLLLSFTWAINFFFSLPWWSVSLLTFFVFFLLFWQAFSKMRLMSTQILIWSWINALILSEISWVALFLPVHFLTAAALSFGVFYLLYMLSYLHLQRRLTKKKIYFQTAIILVVWLASLLSSSWQP